MSGAAGTSVETLVAALKQRRAALPFEIGAYVALAACERLLEAPAVAGGRDVRIGADGEVRVVGASAANDADAARALLALLAQLLVAAGPGVPAALLALVETRESPSLDAVRDALARALMPLNRAASRRVLARLVRESVRELRPAASDDAPAAVDGLDEDLDALLGAAPPAPEAPPSIGHGPPPSESDVSPSALAAALAALAAEEAEEDAAAPDSPASAAPAASASVPPTSAPATHTASLAEPVPATPASSASVPSPAAPATPASSASVPSPAAPADPRLVRVRCRRRRRLLRPQRRLLRPRPRRSLRLIPCRPRLRRLSRRLRRLRTGPSPGSRSRGSTRRRAERDGDRVSPCSRCCS